MFYFVETQRWKYPGSQVFLYENKKEKIKKKRKMKTKERKEEEHKKKEMKKFERQSLILGYPLKSKI